MVVDGLRASALGAYGNTTFATPALDQFAVEGTLLDWCFAASPDLAEIYRALWYLQDATQAQSGQPSTFPISLPRTLAHRGYSTTLVTDEPSVDRIGEDAGFEQTVQPANDQNPNKSAHRSKDPSETELARIFTAATEAIQQASSDKPQFVWLHSRGMYGSWDAPIEFQESLLDEGDPPPIESATPPDLVLKSGSDPDAIFQYASAYAAQIMVLDACIERILESLPAGKRWLVMLIGARGFPLGEHARIGGVDSRLYAETLHVPWLIRLPDKKAALTRNSLLTSHVDVAPTLLDGLEIIDALGSSSYETASVLAHRSTKPTKWRDAVVSTSPSSCVIRTTSWSLRRDQANANEPELYVRPDDRWEANNVAKLCPDIVEELANRLTISGGVSPGC